MIHLNKDGKAKCGNQSYRRFSFTIQLTDDISQVNCKKCAGKVQRNSTFAPIEKDMVGTIFHTSFGYDMTINEYVKVISQTEKSLVVKECYAVVKDDYGRGNGKAIAGGYKPDGKEFRIFRKVKKYTDRYNGQEHVWESWVGTLHGSADSWSIWDGKENYHNTWD